MEKISLIKIVEFTRKSDKSKKTFINNLKKPKEKTTSEVGGDYWIISSSAIGNYFKTNKKELILEKINEVIEKNDKATAKISKNMYQKNIEILHQFEDYDFTSLKPKTDLDYLDKSKNVSIERIKGIPVFFKPTHVFAFNENNTDQIGAIWFTTKLNGLTIPELTLFADALYRYLNINYSEKFVISPEYCIAMDLVSSRFVRYSQIQNHQIASIFNSTLEAMSKLL